MVKRVAAIIAALSPCSPEPLVVYLTVKITEMKRVVATTSVKKTSNEFPMLDGISQSTADPGHKVA